MHNRVAEEAETDDAEDEQTAGTSKGNTNRAGYFLEFDAARKIAQGLGAHLEQLTGVVQVKGETARLLPVSERAKSLFGKEETQARTSKAKKSRQKTLFEEPAQEAGDETGWGQLDVPRAGHTVLDRLHQTMILFAAGRGEAIRRFLVEEGAGKTVSEHF
jgi:hypothetical protein